MDVGESGGLPERKYQMEVQEGPGASRGEDPLLGQDLSGGAREGEAEGYREVFLPWGEQDKENTWEKMVEG